MIAGTSVIISFNVHNIETFYKGLEKKEIQKKSYIRINIFWLFLSFWLNKDIYFFGFFSFLSPGLDKEEDIFFRRNIFILEKRKIIWSNLE